MRLAIFVLAAASVFGQQEKLFADIDPVLAELSEITGLERPAKLERDFITRDRLKKFLEERIAEVVKPEEIRAEELALKMFGLLPREFDLKKTTVDLLTEQAAAFYDYKKKRLFILEGSGEEMQKIALVHELAHALADAHFKLEKYIDRGKSDDAVTARGAVMEGQAQWLMMEYLARRSGQSLKDNPSMVELAARGSDMFSSQFPVLAGAPLYLKESLLFPYTAGLLFQQRVVEKLGKEGFREVFRRPPASSQHIIHPEKYFSRMMPSAPELPKFGREGDYKKLIEGAVGEFDHSVLLRQYVGKQEASDVAPHWKGGRFRLLEHKKRGEPLLLYVVEWDTEEMAKTYFTLYQKVLAMKWKNFAPSSVTAARVEGRSDDGGSILERSGAVVSTIEGIR